MWIFHCRSLDRRMVSRGPASTTSTLFWLLIEEGDGSSKATKQKLKKRWLARVKSKSFVKTRVTCCAYQIESFLAKSLGIKVFVAFYILRYVSLSFLKNFVNQHFWKADNTAPKKFSARLKLKGVIENIQSVDIPVFGQSVGQNTAGGSGTDYQVAERL